MFSICPYVLLPLDLRSGTSFLHGGRKGVVVAKLSKLGYKCPAGPRHESGSQPYHALHMALLLRKSQLNTCLFFQLWGKSKAPKLQQLVQRSPWHLHPSRGLFVGNGIHILGSCGRGTAGNLRGKCIPPALQVLGNAPPAQPPLVVVMYADTDELFA